MEDMIQVAPVVSIIVPVFNVEKYIAQCLNSLTSQTLRNIEIICINDCSTDGSLQILQEYADKDNRIIVIDLPVNIKQGGARNVGIKKAKASFLGFVDSDDWVALDMYEKLYTAALENKADMVCSDYYQYNNKNDIRLQINCDPKVFALSTDERNKHIVLGGCRLYTNIIKKDIFIQNKIEFPEELFYEDNAIVAALYLSAHKLVKDNHPYYYYRCDNASTTRSYNNYRFFDRIKTSIIFLDNMKRLGFYTKYKDEVDFRFIELFYVNTILGAISQFTPPEREYVDRVKEGMKSVLPDFVKNKYYQSRISLKIRMILAVIYADTGWGIRVYQVLKSLKKSM